MNKLLLILILLTLSKTLSKEIYLGEMEVKMVVIELSLTYDNILSEMNKIGLKHPDILLKQIKIETGNLKKIKGNNLFGFRKNNYISYDTWTDCIKYAKVWQDKRYKGGDYYTFLENINYAEDPLYNDKVKKVLIN